MAEHKPEPDADADADPAPDATENVEQALDAAEASVRELADAVADVDEAGGVAGGVAGAGEAAGGIDLLSDVDLDVVIELGRTEMLVEDVLKLASGSVVELDKLAGDPVDVRVNGRLVARGEVLVLNDNFCIRISDVLANLEEEAQAMAGTHPGEPAQPVTPNPDPEAGDRAAGGTAPDATPTPDASPASNDE